MTTAGQPITFQAYRGLWKQCYGSGNGFNDQCNKYTQGISQLAKTGLVGLRACMGKSFYRNTFAGKRKRNVQKKQGLRQIIPIGSVQYDISARRNLEHFFSFQYYRCCLRW